MREQTTTEPAGDIEPPRSRPGTDGLRRAAEVFLRWREASIALVAIGLVVYFQASTGGFLTEDNLVNVSQYVAAIAIIAAGEVLVLVNGELDLSVGHVFAFSPFVMHFAIDSLGFPVLLAILLAVVVSSLVGLVNGLITVLLGVPSFVTTLGMMFAISGITLTTFGSFPESIPPEAYGVQPWLGQLPWAEISWAIVIVVAFHVLLTRTRWGLHTVAVGGNKHAASEAGIRIGRVKIGNFMVCSALGGFAGVIEAFRINTIDATAGGTTIMFYAIAAAVIGGTALAGGSGTVLGALVGAIVLGVLRVGFNNIGVQAYTFDLILGVAILIAMVANVRLTRLRGAGGI